MRRTFRVPRLSNFCILGATVSLRRTFMVPRLSNFCIWGATCVFSLRFGGFFDSMISPGLSEEGSLLRQEGPHRWKELAGRKQLRQCIGEGGTICEKAFCGCLCEATSGTRHRVEGNWEATSLGKHPADRSRNSGGSWKTASGRRYVTSGRRHLEGNVSGGTSGQS